jgi:hypothetical protein
MLGKRIETRKQKMGRKFTGPKKHEKKKKKKKE